MSELFSAFGLDWKLLVIQTVNFALLLAILWRFLYTPLVKMLDERRGLIADSVQKAEAADRRLAEADAEGKTLLAEAGKEAESLVASGRSRAESQSAEILKKTQEKAEALLSDAEARAEEAKRQALAAGEKEIARAAMLAAEKILKDKHA
ncbi:F0F1 ATP synthase subunit B [bacterium]|nr:F0F1 ATP synthase subunit B [bacterium]